MRAPTKALHSGTVAALTLLVGASEGAPRGASQGACSLPEDLHQLVGNAVGSGRLSYMSVRPGLGILAHMTTLGLPASRFHEWIPADIKSNTASSNSKSHAIELHLSVRPLMAIS